MLQNNNIDNEFISKIIKEPLGDAFSVKKTEEDATDDIQKVRYQGGEEVKDSNGETITEEKKSIIPPFSKKEVPLTRKKGEPENSQELSQDIHKYMDKGLSFNEAWEKEMKEYPGTAKNINEYYKARENYDVDNDKEYQYTNDVINYDEKGKGWKSKLSPKESVEVESLNKLGIDSLLRGDDYYNAAFRLPDEERSLPATKLYQYLVDSKKIDEWQDLMSNPSGSFANFKNSLLDEIKNAKNLKAQEKNDIINLLNETGNGYTKWLTALNKQAEKDKQEEEAKQAKAAKTPKPETLGSFTTADGKTTDVKYPPVATLTDKNGNVTVIDSKQYQENREKDAINEANKQAEKTANKQTETQPETKEDTSTAIEDDKSINTANKTHLASLEKKSAEELEAERETAAERAKRISDQLEEKERYEEWLKNPTILSGIFGKSGMDLAKRIGLGTATLSAIASDVLANYAKGLNGSTDFSNKAVAELNKYVDMVNTKKAEAIAEKVAKPYKTDAENEEKLNQSVTKLKRTSAGLYIPDNALRFLVQNAQLGKPLIEDEKELAIFLNQAEKGFIDSIGKNEKEKGRYVVENDDGTETLTPEGRAVFLDEMETSLSDFGRVLELDDTKIANGLKLLETEKQRAGIIKDISAARLENTTQFMNAEADIKQRIVEASKLKTELSEVQDREQSLKLAQQGKSAFGDLSRKTSIDSLTKEERNELFNSEEFSEVKRNLDEELKKHGYSIKTDAKAGIKVVKLSANADWTEEQANTAVKEATTNFLNKNSENNVKSNNINNSINKMIDNAINDVYRLYNDSSVEDFKEKREEALNRIDELIRTLEGYSTEIQRLKNDYLNKNPAEKANYENILNKYNNKVEEQPNNNNEMLNAFNTYRVPTNNINWYKHKLGLV